MKTLLQLEEAAQLAFAIWVLHYQPVHFVWWVWPLLFLAPDISMVGYLINSRVGAALYNLAHHKAVALVLIVIGLKLSAGLFVAGVILYGHSSMDRIMGYGLKYNDAFGHTHLGMIGKDRNEPMT
ncbi:MAG: DUF4260 domain-containing protein [Taibaiella sp.]|nr:DUF4260 domain-containing protein [Taibaiella sp.]